MSLGMKNKALAVGAMQDRTPFRAATLSGSVGGGLPRGHRLPEPYAGQYAVLLSAGDVAYTVYSYDTPIAWVTVNGTVVIPDVKYGVTTSQHQGVVREALS